MKYMPTQQRKARENFIGILTDVVEDRRTAELLPKSGRPRMMDYLRGLMAAVLDRDRETR